MLKRVVLSAGLAACAVSWGAESVRDVVDTSLEGWPKAERDRVQGALFELANAKSVSTEQIVNFLSGLTPGQIAPPFHPVEAASVVVATIEAAKAESERSTDEEVLYQSQYAKARVVGAGWLEAHRAWFPEGIVPQAVAAFEKAITRAQANPFSLGFQRPLPTGDHAQLMAQWEQFLEELDALGEVGFRDTYKVMLLNRANTPGWEWRRNEEAASGAALGVLQHYLELRQEMAVERIPDYAAVRTAREALLNAETKAQQSVTSVMQPVGFESHEDLLDQEVLWFAKAAVEGRCPFTPQALDDGTYSLAPPESFHEVPYEQYLLLNYGDTNQGTSGSGPVEQHALRAIVQKCGACARLEFLARTPILSRSAIFMESIGWTLVRDPEGLAWLPGYMGASKGIYRASVNEPEGPDIDCGFLEWGLSRKTSWALYNLANANGGVFVPGNAQDPATDFEFGWARQVPWLYMSRIERLKYALRDLNGERVLDTAQLIDANTGKVAAMITWRDPDRSAGGKRYYREVTMEIAAIALKGLWRMQNGLRDKTPVAPERSIVYRFAEANLDGKSAVVPTYFAVRGAEQSPLVEMTFDAPVAVVETPKELCDPLAVLPISADTVELAFYRLFKEYYYRDKTLSADAAMANAGNWLTRFAQVRDRALAEGDLPLALKCQIQVYGAAIFGRAQYPDWKAEVHRTMEMLEETPERGVVWDAYASMLQRVYRVADPVFASEVESRFTRMVAERYSVSEALALGGDYGFVYALSCFSAVESKSTDRNILIPATIGKAGALAFVAKFVRNQREPWAVVQCEIYLNAARETLARAESSFAPGDPEGWDKLAERARRSINDAARFLGTAP